VLRRPATETELERKGVIMVQAVARTSYGRAALLALGLAIGIGGALSPGAAALAQTGDYPNRAIRIIVPLAPGGPTDAKARLIAPKLQEKFGQPVIVENKTGAVAQIGTEFVAKSPPDGYTLLMGTPSLTITEAISKDLPYDRKRDFIPVALAGAGPLVLVSPPNMPFKTAADLIAYAKANDGKGSYASVGHGSISHLTMELFCAMAGIKMANIQYRGTGPAMVAVMAGEVQATVDAITTAAAQIDGGKVTALAVTTARRSPLLPNVPTLVEAGFAGFDIPFWAGLFAPAGTPAAIVEKLNAEVRTALSTADMAEQFRKLGTETGKLSVAEFAKYVDDQAALYAKAAKAAGIGAKE
jgi:tripartite-type tricarboxylate transporter receptor subunit TctC